MMLLTEQTKVSFDLSAVRCGDVLWGKHRTWKDGKAGFVSAAAGDKLVVQYHPGIGNVTNHFVVLAAEAAAGEWEIRWSSDMLDVHSFDPDAADSSPEEGEGNESG